MITGTGTDTGIREGRTGITRPVALAGIVLGTALTVWAMGDAGFRLRIPDLPSIIGTAFGAVIIWLLFMAAASVLSELAVRHHRAAFRHGWRYGRRGLAAAGRGTAARSRPWRTRTGAAIRARWAARDGEPLMVRRPSPDPAATGEAEAGDEAAPRPRTSGLPEPAETQKRRVCAACGNPEGGTWGPLISYDDGEPGSGLRLIHLAHFEDPAAGYRSQPHTPGPGETSGSGEPGSGEAEIPAEPGAGRPGVPPPPRICAACGNPEGGTWGPLVTYNPAPGGLTDRPRFIHKRHFEDESSGFFGRPYQEGNQMENTTSRTPRERGRDRGRRAAVAAAGAAGAAWRQLIAATADYEPEDDSALLDWMAGEATGMASYAESITDVYDTAVSGVGLDPVPLNALHDYADAAAACAEAMAAARAKFADHYAQVREFAAAGGLLPHDGRWITGEGT
jgi:hypothetical protein